MNTDLESMLKETVMAEFQKDRNTTNDPRISQCSDWYLNRVSAQYGGLFSFMSVWAVDVMLRLNFVKICNFLLKYYWHV